MRHFCLLLFFFSSLFATSPVVEQTISPLEWNRLIQWSRGVVLETKQIELRGAPGAFNPSLISYGDNFLLCFRYMPDVFEKHWISEIGLVVLGKDLIPISEPQFLNTRDKTHPTPSQAEDARFFKYRGQIYLLYNDNPQILSPTNKQRRDMYMAPLLCQDNQFSLGTPQKLTHPKKYDKQMWQKNWLPFEKEDKLYFTYSISPHEILRLNPANGECLPSYETRTPLTWDKGVPRGSSAPILINGEYFALFHSGKKFLSPVSGGHLLWHYFMGAYSFSAEPPFAITKITPSPIVTPGFYEDSGHEKRVVFPGSCEVCDGKIYMAYGRDDCEMWVAILDQQKLFALMHPIQR